MTNRIKLKAVPATEESGRNSKGRSDQPVAGDELIKHKLHRIRKEKEANGHGQSLIYKAEEAFRYAASSTAQAMGSAVTFVAAVAIVVGWAICGPIFHYSENWQLVINTGTTIITFLMIFLVQNTQNRESRAIQLKLDELLRGVRGARTGMVDLEHATDEELAMLQREFEALRKKPRTNSPERQEKSDG